MSNEEIEHRQRVKAELQEPAEIGPTHSRCRLCRPSVAASRGWRQDIDGEYVAEVYIGRVVLRWGSERFDVAGCWCNSDRAFFRGTVKRVNLSDRTVVVLLVIGCVVVAWQLGWIPWVWRRTDYISWHWAASP